MAEIQVLGGPSAGAVEEHVSDEAENHVTFDMKSIREIDQVQNFIIPMKPPSSLELDYNKKGETVSAVQSKVCMFYGATLNGRMKVLAKRPINTLKESPHSKSFVREVYFLTTDHASRWHYHPNIVQNFGIVILHEIPYLLSEPMHTDLNTFLENDRSPLSYNSKVSIVRDIAAGLTFLHSRKPVVIHAALVAASVHLTTKLEAKLSNFCHAGIEGEPLVVVCPENKPITCVEGTNSDENTQANASKEMKLKPSLDMTSLGLLVRAVDTYKPNREEKEGGILAQLIAKLSSKEVVQVTSAQEVYDQLSIFLDEQLPVSSYAIQ